MKIPFSPPDISELEIEEVINTLKSGWITTGPKTKEFEKQIAKYCNTSKAACLGSQTASAEMTLRILGIGKGDEVIVPAYTYTASCSVIIHTGATPVMIDCAHGSYEMDYDKMEKAITKNTKCIIPVDLGGVICNYNRIFDAVMRRKSVFEPKNKIQQAIGRVIVMADGAHAFGAKRAGKVCGQIADFTNFSFHAVKNLTTAEGGAATWKDFSDIDNNELYKQFMLYSLHGQSKDALSKDQPGSWEYDIVGTYYKCNMTDIIASLGLAQLKRYQLLMDRRHEIIRMYNEGLKGLPLHILCHEGDDYKSSGHLYMVRLMGKDVEYRNKLIIKMAEKGIATNVHYKPLPMHTAYKRIGFDINNFPKAYEMYKNEITLPLHTSLKNDEIVYIIESFKNLIKE